MGSLSSILDGVCVRFSMVIRSSVQIDSLLITMEHAITSTPTSPRGSRRIAPLLFALGVANSRALLLMTDSVQLDSFLPLRSQDQWDPMGFNGIALERIRSS